MFNRKKNKGQSLVEYALILSLVAIASVTVLGDLGRTVSTKIEAVNTAITNAPTPD